MGAIVGAAIVSHVPPLMFDRDTRLALNDGRDFTLYDGLHALRAERLDELQPDTIVVFDTHWYTTFEHILTGHERRRGIFTSDELPRGDPSRPYDLPGDPELAQRVEDIAARRDDTWIYATADPHIAIHYPTVNLTPFLQGDERWISVGVCQTASKDDFLLFGAVLAEAIASLDRRVVLLASGGLSHTFWPLRELRQHESADLSNIRTVEARDADLQLIERLEAGAHDAVLDGYDDYRRHKPEAMFAHYLMMVGALGGAECRSKGVRYGEYESAAGTGQVHLWFPVEPVG